MRRLRPDPAARRGAGATSAIGSPRRTEPRRRAAFAILNLQATVLLCACTVVHRTAGDREMSLRVAELELARAPARSTLRVMTLNLAHGRADGTFQGFLRERSIRRNLDRAAGVLAAAGADVVALQEADGPSWWSGNFDHVEHVARAGLYPFRARAENVHGLGLSYGTALLARWPLDDAIAVTFPASAPTMAKGFVKATLEWPVPRDAARRRSERVAVDFVSLHLDFLRPSVRRRQLEELASRLTPRARPLVVLGDFNCGWDGAGTVCDFASRLGLAAYHPESAEHCSFGAGGLRIDWILISNELEFVSYRTLPDVLSDHRAVLAEVRLR